ncbi:sugar phosphate nucleotidyltransferase [Haloarchaeobius sp. TZWSO28]|uniref:sugar phosphate nucleotidyltransferase n=1 Tax=Haloarchaeobius sp. TZWSO28 TaxID=3446119 RepID=UPI003EBF663E
MDITSAIVLAAGEGTRLRPLTKHRPKPMLTAANRPILEYVLDGLADAGIEDIHIVVGYKRDRVQSHFGPAHQNVPITYHVQEKQLGSGHALLQAQESVNSNFLVVNGDEIITDKIVREVIRNHSTEDKATLAVIESDRAPQYGAVRVRDDRIIELVERPGEGDYRLLNRGVYVFEPSIFAELELTTRREGELQLTDAIGSLIQGESDVRAVLVDEIWSNVTYPWNLLTVARDLLAKEMVSESTRDSHVWVSESATVHENAVLRPPVTVSEDVVIGPGTVVGPYTAIGRNCTVDSGAVIERSVIDADTRIGQNATINETVTGQGVEICAGVTIPRGPAEVRVGDRIHDGRNLGCIVADWASLGAGVTVTPGSLIGPEAEIDTGVHVDGNIDEGTEVKR